MKNNLFTIGQTSRIKGITVKALRFYERIGLIKPIFTDAATKYRYYSPEQLIQLDVIKALRSIDATLKDIRGIFEKKDTGQLMEYLDNQKGNILGKISQLRKTAKTIEQTQNTINNSISVIANQEVNTRVIPVRCIITQKVRSDVSEEEVLVQFSKFPMIIEQNNLLDTFETGYYSTPDETGEVHPSLIYNVVTAYKNSNIALLSTIPAGAYLCISFNLQNSQSQFTKLANYLNQNKIQPKLMIQVNLLNDVFAANTQHFETQVFH